LFYAVEQGREQLRKLANDLDASLSQLDGIAKNPKPLRPHVTVARIRKQLSPETVDKLKMMKTLQRASQQVTCIDLMESTLSSSGSSYRRVRRFELGRA
jgi:2'-5' RNA ligase